MALDPRIWFTRDLPKGGIRFSLRHKGRRTRMSHVDPATGERKWNGRALRSLPEAESRSLRGEP